MSTLPPWRRAPLAPAAADDDLPLMDVMSGVMLLFVIAAAAFRAEAETAAASQRQAESQLASLAADLADAQHAAEAAEGSLAALMERTAETDALLAIGRQWQAERQRIAGLLDGALRSSELAAWGAQIVGDGLVVRIPDEAAVFKVGSAELDPQFERLLLDFGPRLIALLADPQFRDAIAELRIEGHTSSEWNDDVSIGAAEAYGLNVALSQDRASAVLRHLIGTNGATLAQSPWAMSRLRAIGVGPAMPILDSTGVEDRARSRRVEFRVVLRSEAGADALLREITSAGAP